MRNFLYIFYNTINTQLTLKFSKYVYIKKKN